MAAVAHKADSARKRPDRARGWVEELRGEAARLGERGNQSGSDGDGRRSERHPLRSCSARASSRKGMKGREGREEKLPVHARG